jgi:hypothetical protein
MSEKLWIQNSADSQAVSTTMKLHSIRRGGDPIQNDVMSYQRYI